MRRFLLSKAILAFVMLWVLGFGVHLLLKDRSGYSRLGASALVLLGACLLLVILRSAREVFFGKLVIEEVISLPLPGAAACELTIPTPMNKGRVIVFFQDTTERYAGKVRLTKAPSEGASPVSATLLRIEPSRIKVPKWSPTSDAGELLEAWPRGTGGAADPVVLRFSFPVEAGEKLKLEFELDSNFKGTKLERRFPITGEERVRIVVKG